MSTEPNPSFSSRTSLDKEFLAQFRLPQAPPQRWLERVFYFLTSTSIFMAAVIAATLYLSFLLQAVVGGALLLIATFCLAFSVYNLNKVSDLKEDLVNQPNRAQFVKKYRDYIVFACLESVNIAVILAFFTNPAAILVILFPFYVGLFYSMGIRRKRIKDVFVLKNIMIAAAITVGASLLPLAIHVAIPLVVLLVAYWFFLKVFTHS